MADALLHSCAVYFYAYDPQTRSYAQQTDAVVGCALLASSGESGADFKLLFYNSQKQPLVQLSVTGATKMTPQQDHYVSFVDDAQQKFYSMRFKDAAGVMAFLSAVAFVKAQQVVLSSSASPHVLVDDIALGKEEGKGYALTNGDVAGIALTVWRGQSDSTDFFTANPLDIAKQQASEVVERDGDLKRVRLVDNGGVKESDDALSKVLATEALIGMQKNAQRLVTVVAPQTQEWFIASVELVKVKKGSRASTAATETESSGSPLHQEQVQAADDAQAAAAALNDDLVQRMANLSRAGSKGGSGLIASLSSRALLNQPGESDDKNGSRKTSFAELQAAVAQKYVPVLLPGVHLSGDKQSVMSPRGYEDPSQHRASQHESLAAKVIAPLKDQSRASSFDLSSAQTPTGSSAASSLSSEMEKLMQEQSDLAQLRKQLEESKRKLQESDDDAKQITPSSSAPAAKSSSIYEQARSPSNGLNGLGQWQSTSAPPAASSFSAISSSYTPPKSALAASSSALYSSTSTSRWNPTTNSLELVPSFQPSSFLTSPHLAPPPPVPTTSFNPSFASTLNSRSLVPTPTFSASSSGSGTSVEVESGILRLQRSSTSIESTLQDIHSKIDRLLNAQGSMKTSKYTSSSGLYSSSTLSSSTASPSSSSSSAILLKNLEKALQQRDQVQELNGRLQEAREQMESTIEELQNQHEALQMENRNLLDKLQNGNHLQQEKFRLELRNVQQQLSHTQEQMLVYQEENYRMRSELAAKDDQLVKEKAQLQEETRKQLESMQRQLEAQLRQDSRDSVDKVVREKTTLESQVKDLLTQKQQWEQERDMMMSQLRQAQSQIQEEKSRSQSVQDTHVQELQVQLQQMGIDARGLSQQVEKFRSKNKELEELLAAKEDEVEKLQQTKSSQEYAALSELLKEFMNDIYFHFQDAFDEDTEFTGKEIVMAIRKILKQNTMDILAKLEEFWQMQAQNMNR
uniref:WH1 domain-containing protein n=1 Tax=Globisporangium ultimum (strain ATCC 200006 / CBS 805.95 / DAOM BR144) TaxID=431595 RepID=K3XAJ2_GLOUD